MRGIFRGAVRRPWFRAGGAAAVLAVVLALLGVVGVGPALAQAGLDAKPSLETRKRLEHLRGQLIGRVLQGERLRAYRAVEVLERIGTPEAREVLQALAKGAPGALVSQSAQAALAR